MQLAEETIKIWLVEANNSYLAIAAEEEQLVLHTNQLASKQLSIPIREVLHQSVKVTEKVARQTINKTLEANHPEDSCSQGRYPIVLLPNSIINRKRMCKKGVLSKQNSKLKVLFLNHLSFRITVLFLAIKQRQLPLLIQVFYILNLIQVHICWHLAPKQLQTLIRIATFCTN